MILSQSQAMGIAKCLSELNNIGASVRFIKGDTYGISLDDDGNIMIRTNSATVVREHYANQSKFFTAYNLD